MKLWKKNLYTIWAAELLAIAGFGASSPIIPFYLQDLGVTDHTELNYWVGLMNFSPSMMLALISPVWGRLADCYGRRLMLLRAMFGGSLFVFLIGFVVSPWQFLVLRSIQGLLTGTVGAATVLVVATVPPEKTGFGVGLLQTAIYIGSSLGPMLGGVVSDLAGHRVTFFVTAALLAMGGLLILLNVKEEFVPQPAAGSLFRRLVPEFRVVIGSNKLILLLLISCAIYMANSVINPILPLFIQTIAGDQSRVASQTGLVLGAAALSSALAAAMLGRMSYRIGYNLLLIVCMAGSFVMTIIQAFAPTPMHLLVFRVAGGFFLGGTIPSVNALIAGSTDSGSRGSVYGITTSGNSMGMALGPALGAVVSVAWGYPAAFFATAVILALAALGALTVRRSNESRDTA